MERRRGVDPRLLVFEGRAIALFFLGGKVRPAYALFRDRAAKKANAATQYYNAISSQSQGTIFLGSVHLGPICCGKNTALVPGAQATFPANRAS